MKATEQQRAARRFAEVWKGADYEKGQTQTFWLSLLRDVYGVSRPEEAIFFEDAVKLEHTNFIDARIPATRVLIEQKGAHVDLTKKVLQSDGTALTPFEQAHRYVLGLPLSEHPRWIVVCNFREIHVHDMEKPSELPQVIALKNLETEYYRLSFLVNADSVVSQEEMAVSVEAGEIVGALYDALLKQYKDPSDPAVLKSLNILCVRIVFCLYAEDAGLFRTHTQFHDYVKSLPTAHLRRGLQSLFRILNTKEEDRDPDEEAILAEFPYVNGGLFADDSIRIPQFSDEIVDLLLEKASAGFDWSDISPTIFGAVFESTLNPETRRKGGMHYTSIENIHKVIDPLFLSDLRVELQRILGEKVSAHRTRHLQQFQEKLAALTFLDPACGSGNFLTETYLSLRRLENATLRAMLGGQSLLGFSDESMNPVKVSLGQFHGIEINDFAVSVAQTALWIAESQMLKETEDIINRNLDFFPLKSFTNIREGNALRMDWREVVPGDKLDFIMGNPPFAGARFMSKAQKQDLLSVFGEGWKNAGDIDYVGSWFKKANDFMQVSRHVRTAFVATNSIVQGSSPANLWAPILASGAHIDFAWRSFVWDSEATVKAHVHCVIVGFSHSVRAISKVLFENGAAVPVKHINAYLIEGEDIVACSRKYPFCEVPEIGMGNQPIDDGQYLFTAEEKAEFLKQEPQAEELFHPFYGAKEFINRKPRYCLWLGECSPAQLRRLPHCVERVAKVREFRLKSSRASTVKLADAPTRFQTENMPTTNYIVIPQVSSERRRYIPLGFMTPNELCSDKLRLMPNATLYHFGVLNSSVHMGWMRTVAGRLKSDYSYSVDIVYNAFVWPEPTAAQHAKIEETAQAILDARALYPDSSLADLYDETTMPAELRKAHRANDQAVLAAYGFKPDASEREIVASIMKLYQRKVEEVERAEAERKPAKKRSKKKVATKADDKSESVTA